MRNARMEWRIVVMLLGLLLLLSAYYVVHKPMLPMFNGFSVDVPTMLARLGGALWDMAAVALLFVASAALGRGVLGKVLGSEFSVLGSQFSVLIVPLVGAGLLAIATMVIALAGALNIPVVVALLVGVALVGWQQAWAWIGDLTVAVRGLSAVRGFARFCAVACALLALLALVVALAPPVSWDAMVYHLVAPREYLSVGRMEADPVNFYLGMPKNGDMLFTLVMALTGGRDTALALAHWGFALLALGLTAGLARRATSPLAGWVAATLLLASYNLWELMGWGYVDWAVLAYALAIFALLVAWRETLTPNPSPSWRGESRTDNIGVVSTRFFLHPLAMRERGTGGEGYLILIGILLGLAVGYKWTAAIIAASVGVYLLIAAPRRVVQNGLLVGVPALLFVAPWLLRGWLQYGNPVYPMLGFGLNWDARRAAAFTRAGLGMIASGEAWQLPLMPFTATILGQNRGPNTSFTHGPFLLTMPFLLPIVWRWLDEAARKLARDLVILIVPLYLIWVYLAATSGTGTQSRLMVPLLGLSAVLGGIAFYGVSKLPRKPLDLGFLLRVVFGLTVVLSVMDAAARLTAVRPLAWLVGGTTTQEYVNQNLGVLYDAMERLDELEDGSQVRMLWDLRTYHCPAQIACIPDTMLDAYSLPIWRGETSDAVFEAWRAGGDDYVLLYQIGYESFTEDDQFYRAENLSFPDAIARHMTPLWSIEYLRNDGSVGVAYTLYEWREE